MEYSDEIKEFKQNFYKYYTNNIGNIVKKYEKKRILILLFACLISIILFTFGSIFALEMIKNPTKMIYLPVFIFFFVGIAIFYIFKKNFEQEIKKQIMPQISKCFNNIEWKKFKIDGSIYVKSGLLKNYFDNLPAHSIDDTFCGEYKNVNISIVEIELLAGQDSKFNGVVITLDMNKNFTGHTIICNDSPLHVPPLKNLRWTKLEDVEFETMFDVFTDDEIEARYILTPSFMERIKEIEFTFKSAYIRCAFYQSKLLVAVHTKKDLFSIGNLFKKVNNFEQYKILCEQFVSILALIDHLKLHSRPML